MVHEAPLEATEHGLVPKGEGWFVDEVALRRGAGVETETSEARVAYVRVPKRESTDYRDGWLPD